MAFDRHIGNDPFAARVWRMAHGRTMTLGPRPRIAGIANITPDSFSDGGEMLDCGRAVERIRSMVEDGADMVDIGGESTRPGAEPVDARTEQSRILPVIAAVAGMDVALSVDTWRAETARLAIAAGAHVINDIWGLSRDRAMPEVAAETGAGVILMHNGRERERDPDPVKDQIIYFKKLLKNIDGKGIDEDKIVLDPGFGFAKEPDDNLALLARLEALHELGYPLMAGTSRKRFLGHVTGRGVDERDIATAATSVVARMKGAAMFRVHDVRTNLDALRVADAVLEAGRKGDRS